MIKVGRNIARLRGQAGITQMGLADKLGISYQAVSNWERGNSMPDIAKLPELAEIFGVSIEEILDEGKATTLISSLLENKSGSTCSSMRFPLRIFPALHRCLKWSRWMRFLNK